MSGNVPFEKFIKEEILDKMNESEKPKEKTVKNNIRI